MSSILEEKLRNGVRESLKKRFKERRSKLEILADILLVSKSGAGKTEIVYKANLNFERLRSYLAYMEANGLLENLGSIYKSTERGKKFLRDYQMIKEMFQDSTGTTGSVSLNRGYKEGAFLGGKQRSSVYCIRNS